MKRKISFAFVIMCFITLMSLGDIIGTILNVFRLFKNFSMLRTLKTLCKVIENLTPAAIATLLYFNRKQDIKPKAYTALMVCGCVKLLRVVLILPSLVPQFASPLSLIVPLAVNLTSIVLGVLLIVVAKGTESGKTNGAVKGFGFAGIWLGIFLLIASIFPYLSTMGGLSFLSSLNIILFALGLWCLPKTFYDYDNCFFFGGNAIKLMCGIAAAVIFVMIVAGGEISGGGGSTSCGHQSCKENGPFYCLGKGNTCNNRTYCAYDLYCDACD